MDEKQKQPNVTFKLEFDEAVMVYNALEVAQIQGKQAGQVAVLLGKLESAIKKVAK